MGNIAAFDIGGTFVKHGVISENGEVVKLFMQMKIFLDIQGQRLRKL